MKLDWITLIIVIVMTLCLAFAGFYYYETKINTCTSNPLVYGAKQITNLYGYEFEGYGYLNIPFNVQSPKFYFNSENLSVE